MGNWLEDAYILYGVEAIGLIVLRLVCVFVGHRWLAMVWGDHVTLHCDRCGVTADAEFFGRQPYVVYRVPSGSGR